MKVGAVDEVVGCDGVRSGGSWIGTGLWHQ